ncbi:MAG: recombinase family protein, partial [Chloroflexi bacterium]|nr:recombinase family protein [Chloroflexota bacterium]
MATVSRPAFSLASNATSLAAAYFRVSTAEQAGDGHQSLDVQREKAHQEAAKRGLTIVREFIDVASGTRASREQYQTMLAYLRTNAVGHVLIGSLDRLGRDQRELLTAAWEFGDLGVELVAIDRPFDARNI